MFEAEQEGLAALAATETVRVPRVIGSGVTADQAWLVLEHLALAPANSESAAQLGRDLAAMHHCSTKRYGWHRDNTIGSTPQHNGYADSWLQFWREQRLGYQLERAKQRGAGRHLQRSGASLMDRLDELLGAHQPLASPLHGDLWSGNYACCEGGIPVIFDPAFYYGDRESDLAMTELFGGFPPAFYAAYSESSPLPEGYAVRKPLYQLYHLLNHYNLFGAGYLGEVEALLDQLLQA